MDVIMLKDVITVHIMTRRIDMGLRILKGDDGYQCLYCSTTDWAFGPIFYDNEETQDFLDWLGKDARSLKDNELAHAVANWRIERQKNDKK